MFSGKPKFACPSVLATCIRKYFGAKKYKSSSSIFIYYKISYIVAFINDLLGYFINNS